MKRDGESKPRARWSEIIGTIIAAALILPLAWWLKQNGLFGFEDWLRAALH